MTCFFVQFFAGFFIGIALGRIATAIYEWRKRK